MEQTQCKICKTKFAPTNSIHKYCSNKCRKEKARRTARKNSYPMDEIMKRIDKIAARENGRV